MPAGALTKPSTGGQMQVCLEALDRSIDESPDRILAVAVGMPIMICRGANEDYGCIYGATCPFVTHAIPDVEPPVGEYCPVELKYLSEFYKGYRAELNPEGTSFSTMSLVKEMCVLELGIMRAERLLAIDGAVVELVNIGFDKESAEIISKPEMSAKAHVWRLLLKEKIKLFEQMGLTPKAKAAIGSTFTKDPSTFAAELISQAEKIFAQRERDRLNSAVEAHGRRTDVGTQRPALPEPITVKATELPVTSPGGAAGSAGEPAKEVPERRDVERVPRHCGGTPPF